MALSDYFKEQFSKGKANVIASAKRGLKRASLIAVAAIPTIALLAIIAGAAGDSGGDGGGSGGSGGAGGAGGMQSASDDSWEQFLRFVLTNEGGTKTDDGNYYIVEDDSVGNPTVGHGLCLKDVDDGIYLHVSDFAAYGIDSKALANAWLEGDRNGKIEVSICDAIWRENLEGLYNGISSQYPDLKEYQKYALVDVKYRRGNTDGFKSAYESKWTAADDKYGNYVESEEPYDTNTLFGFFWKTGHSREGVRTRKKNQWLLFKYGYYKPLGEYAIINSGGAGESGGSGGTSGKATGFWWPIEKGSDGKPRTTYISSGYDYRTLDGEYKMHYGIDISRGNSPKIIAAYDGEVTHAGNGDYGTSVYIKHKYKGETLYTIYGHMVAGSIPSNVKVGSKVTAGTVLGTMGKTGYVTGVHLHFEVRKDTMSAAQRANANRNPLNFVDPNNPYPTD